MILTAVGVNLVTSPMVVLIFGFATMVAELFLSSSACARKGGFIMLGGALSTLGLPAAIAIIPGKPGGGTFGRAPGGRRRRGGGTPEKKCTYFYLRK